MEDRLLSSECYGLACLDCDSPDCQCQCHTTPEAKHEFSQGICVDSHCPEHGLPR